MIFRSLCGTLLISSFSFSLYAQEEKSNPYELLAKDVYFQPGGGLRVRYDTIKGGTGGGFPNNENDSQIIHRAQLDFKLYKGEYFETFFRLINVADWGTATNNTSGGQSRDLTGSHGLWVNQAYALWKVDEYVDSVRFGRAPLHIGLGYTYGLNDWFNTPYAFDLIDLGWDWGNVELNLMATQVQGFDNTTRGATTPSDPDENHFIINLDIKSPIETVEFFSFNLIQVNRGAVLGLAQSPSGPEGISGLSQQRLSMETKMVGQNFFGEAFLSYVVGKEERSLGGNSSQLETENINQSALDMKLGYRWPQTGDLRLWVGYHRDSGDQNPEDGESGQYDSFFYDIYGQSGLMDFIRWGNLSFYHLGIDLSLFLGFRLGTQWWSFQRSQGGKAPPQFGEAGRFFAQAIGRNGLTLGEGQDLGNELDLFVDRTFTSGMNLRVTFSNFFPGAVFAEARSNQLANPPDSDFFQFLAQVGYFF